MITDYDEDAHFCLKCHATILGLDNYVAHRKSGCSKPIQEPPKSPLPSQLLPQDETFSLIADDFFSSLELQSSSKKVSTGGKSISGVLTRSKTSAVIQAANTHKDTEHQEAPPKSGGKHTWIGGHQFKALSGNDNQTKLIKAVDNLSQPIERKEIESTIDEYDESEEESEEFDYDDESEDEDVPPRISGGKWKPSSSPVQWSECHRDWSIPPPSYTGGKWNPNAASKAVVRNVPPPTFTKGKWKTSSPSPTYTGGKWPQKSSSKQEFSEIPPPSNTKGKWKPINPLERDDDIPPPENTKGKWKPGSPLVPETEATFQTDRAAKAPSPSYTKGKWKPSNLDESRPTQKSKIKKFEPQEESPFRKSGGTIQYWCGPCNRRLASKVVYERHLKSELHFKRKLRESEFDENSIEPIEVPKNRKRIKKKPFELTKPKTEKKQRIRKKLFIKCNVCHSRVSLKMIGKHLISHYHCRRSDIRSQPAREMILEYIHDIVRQSPFQCGCCKFYCNTQSEFLTHWKSQSHLEAAKGSGFFRCTFCKFETYDNDVMFSHLISNEHSEVLSVINRSVPVVIKKLTPLACETCGEEFLLNILLRAHCRLNKHTYKDDYTCGTCQKKFKSSVSLNIHQRKRHKESIYGCNCCGINFSSAEEAKAHRNSLEHRHRTLVKKKKEGKQTCDYCKETFENFLLLKEHLKERHFEFGSKCPNCGMTFAIPQELSVHVRSKSCNFQNKTKESKHVCEKCEFKTDSTSEYLFHKVLHTEPLLVYTNPENSSQPTSSSSEKPIPQYKCPICEKFYAKASLQCHLRVHTKERPFVCGVCGAGFVRKNNWALHVRRHDEDGGAKKGKEEGSVERPYLCSTCGANFKRKFVLQQHMTTHTGKEHKCPKHDCIFTARSTGELNEHLQTHTDLKSFQCDRCDYKGNTKRQLIRHQSVHSEEKKYKCSICEFTARFSGHVKRHERTHTGMKPFGCPHCSYRCSTLENLRKHVLSTNKHPGKSIYECKFCNENRFATNLAKELKLHLMEKHGDVFLSSSSAATYVTGIYEPQITNREKQHEVILEESELQREIEEDSNAISQMRTFEDPVVAGSTTSTVLLPFSKQQDKNQEELFPMFIVAKDEVVSVDSTADAWSMIGSYDAESGVLIPFQSDGETLFQEF